MHDGIHTSSGMHVGGRMCAVVSQPTGSSHISMHAPADRWSNMSDPGCASRCVRMELALC